MDDLIDLERRGWEALSSGHGAAFYGELLASDAVFVVPGAVLDRAAVVASIDDADPWVEHRMDDVRVARPAPDVGVVAYRATARRAEGPEYVALMTTTYVRVEGRWLVAVHQQTPL